MLDLLKVILDVQELDMKMLRLMALKAERRKELDQIQAVKGELHEQVELKRTDVNTLKAAINDAESKISACQTRVKTLEGQQHTVKRVDEFNALSQEIANIEREKAALEQKGMELNDQLGGEEEMLAKLAASETSTVESSAVFEKEITERILSLNAEGRDIKTERDSVAKQADPEIFAIYERLLQNKRDRVLVPLENRACSGCHIVVTAQHENLVRKSERLVFCEHCSRIHYWPEPVTIEATEGADTKRRRRRTTTTK